MARRTYRLPFTGNVTVDSEAGTVDVEVEIHDLAADLKYDYEVDHTEEEVAEDGETVQTALNASPLNFYITRHLP
jgi:hypothetical protein